MMSSTRYLVEAGSTSPETRLMIINPRPSANKRAAWPDQLPNFGQGLEYLGFLGRLGWSAIHDGVKSLDSSDRDLGSEAG